MSYDNQVPLFLSEYKTLVRQFENSRTSSGYIDLLCKSSGSQVLPSIIFEPNGQEKSLEKLKEITHQQLSFLIKQNGSGSSISFLLLVNLKRDQKTRNNWLPTNESPKRETTARQWFKQKFNTTDQVSCRTIREILMRHGVLDLRFYLTNAGEARSDTDRLLTQLWTHRKDLFSS